METREEKAIKAFKEGYNCAQSIMVAYADLMEVDEKTAVRMASSFGGGMGRMREVCGAVSGIFMVAGYLYGYDAPGDYEGKKELYRIIQDLANEFKKESGSIICRELLGLDGNDNSHVPSKRTKEYYDKRPCPEKVGLASRILEEYIRGDN